MSDPHRNLDDAMGRRRLDLGMKTWRDLASAAGISYETLRAFRKGEGTPAEATIHGLERALRWEVGSLQNVMAGGEPRPVGGLPPITAEMRGSVGEDVPPDTEPDTPVTAQIQALLAQAQARTEEKLAALTQKFDEQQELLEQQREMIQRLLDERKGA